MKKLIQIILLTTTASSSLLLAQSNNRLEFPLQRQEMEDRRWKMEVEAQGCRVQKVEDGIINEGEYNNQVFSLEKDSIPICHLLSSISSLGITPKLMMDPMTIGKGAETLGEELGIVEKQAVSGKTPAVENAITSSPIESSSSSSANFSCSTSSPLQSSIFHLPSPTAAAVSSPIGSSYFCSSSAASAMLSSFSSSSSATLKTGSNTANAASNDNSDQESAFKKQRKDDSTSSLAPISAYCQNFLNTTAEINYPNEVLASGTDHTIIENLTVYKNKVLEAVNAENYSLAKSWIQVLENLKQAVESSPVSSSSSNFACSSEPQGSSSISYFSSPATAAVLPTASIRPVGRIGTASSMVSGQGDVETINAISQPVASFAEALSEAQEIIKETNRTAEAAFFRARAAKSEGGWNEAKEVAMEVSNYWNDVAESIKSGRNFLAISQAEATFQRDYWIEKAAVAEVKALAIIPCRIEGEDRQCQNAKIMSIIKNKIWPTLSQAMKDFIEHPSEVRMRNASSAASIATSTAAVVVIAPADYNMAYIYASTYASTSIYASTASYIAAEAYAISRSYAYGKDCCYASTYASDYVSTVVFSCFSTVARIFSESASGVAEYEKIFKTLERISTFALKLTRTYSWYFTDTGKENIAWSVQSVREAVDFTRAVIRFKREQETSIQARDGRGERGEEMHPEEERRRVQNAQIEQGKLAEIEALAASPCYETMSHTQERADTLMKMTREKFGSPVLPAMREFMTHPNEASLRATGKFSVIAMTADEAEENLETAEIFAKASADIATEGRGWRRLNPALQETADWSELITREIVEFARAVAIFKDAQHP